MRGFLLSSLNTPRCRPPGNFLPSCRRGACAFAFACPRLIRPLGQPGGISVGVSTVYFFLFLDIFPTRFVDSNFFSRKCFFPLSAASLLPRCNGAEESGIFFNLLDLVCGENG